MHGVLVSDCLFAHVQEQACAWTAGAPRGAASGMCMDIAAGSRGAKGCALQACAFAGTCMARRGTAECALRMVHRHRHGQRGHQGVRPPSICISRHVHGQQGHQGVRPPSICISRHMHGQQGHHGVRPQASALDTGTGSRGTKGCALPAYAWTQARAAGAPGGAPFRHVHLQAQAQAAGAPGGAPFRHVHGHSDSRGTRGCALSACAWAQRQQGHRGVHPLAM
jgi:hypothetical protein